MDQNIRMAAFQWLHTQVDLYGDVLPRKLLEAGFSFKGEQVRLVGPQGIWKPKILSQIPLSITTSPNSSYPDRFGSGGLLGYAYRGTNPFHHENVGLREAMKQRVPLIYFYGLVPGKYLAAWPVFVVGDDPASLKFQVALDDAKHIGSGLELEAGAVADSDPGEGARREYITSTFKRRVHQGKFRERVLEAYQEQCALCRLKHQELLDAAHIIPDSDPEGEPVVQNGLSLCKLHHAAYDRNFLSIRPDYVIEVRQDVLDEEDGPMLRHGLKGMHHQAIVLPRSVGLRPDRDRLERRYEQFLGR